MLAKLAGDITDQYKWRFHKMNRLIEDQASSTLITQLWTKGDSISSQLSILSFKTKKT